MTDNNYLAWREENVDRLAQVVDWRELCLELLEAADILTVENDGSDAYFDLVADRVRQLAIQDNPRSGKDISND
jgi:hypothetical protein